jgi:hypothetical protein
MFEEGTWTWRRILIMFEFKVSPEIGKQIEVKQPEIPGIFWSL